jgi:hypothetical protein
MKALAGTVCIVVAHSSLWSNSRHHHYLAPEMKRFWLKTAPALGLIALTLLSVYGTVARTNDPILFNIGVGFVNAVIFWLLVVVWPERKRRKVIRENLRRRYQDFRETAVLTLLHVAGICNSTDGVQELTDHRKFKAFFDADNKARWYDALNGLQDQRERMDDLLLEMEMLADEVRYVLNKVDIDDASVHAAFKNLCAQILRLRSHGVYSHDPVKYVGQFVWGVLAQWSFIDGQMEADPIQKLIDSI